MREAFRYVAKDPTDDRPHMALYYIEDVEGIFDKVKDVPHHDESLPGSHDMFDYADFDTRIYKFVQLYELENPPSGKAVRSFRLYSMGADACR